MVLAPLGVKSLLQPLNPLGFEIQLMRLKTPLGQYGLSLQPPPPLSPFLQTVLIDQQPSDEEFPDVWTPGSLSAIEESEPQFSNRAILDTPESPIATKSVDPEPAVEPIVQRQPLGRIEPLAQASDFLPANELSPEQKYPVSPTTPQAESQPSNQTKSSEVVLSQPEILKESTALDTSNTSVEESTLPIHETNSIALNPLTDLQSSRSSHVQEASEPIASDLTAASTTETFSEFVSRSTQADLEVETVSEADDITASNFVSSDRLTEPSQQPSRADTSELVQTQRESDSSESSTVQTDLNAAEITREDQPLVLSQQPEAAQKLPSQQSELADTGQQERRQSVEDLSLSADQPIVTTEMVSASPLLDHPAIEPASFSQTSLLQPESEITPASNPSLLEASEIQAVDHTVADSLTNQPISPKLQAISEVEPDNVPRDNLQRRTEDSSLDLATPLEATIESSQVSQPAIVQQISPSDTESSTGNTISLDQIQQDVQPVSSKRDSIPDAEPFVSPKTEETVAEGTQSGAQIPPVEITPDLPLAELLLVNQPLATLKDAAPVRLQPLSAPEPLVQLSNFLTPEASEEPDEPRSQEAPPEAINPIAPTENDSIVHRSTVSEIPTEQPPTPESWSNIAELLGKPTDSEMHTSEPSFTQPSDSIQTSSKSSQTLSNTVQPLTSNSTASMAAHSSNEAPDEWSSLAELIGEQKLAQSTESANKVITSSVPPTETAVTLTSPQVQTAPQLGKTETKQKTEKIDPQDFEQLAQSVYRLIQTELAIERERYWNHDTGLPRWLTSTALPTSAMGAGKKERSPINGSQLSTTDVKLQTLAREIQLQLKQQLEVERERCGIYNARRSF